MTRPANSSPDPELQAEGGNALQVGLAWASWASVPFIGGSVSPARRALAVYPLLLLYVAMGWLALIKG